MADGRAPDVSVIIPTYNRARELDRTLRTLALQDLPLDRYEVIVADDGSSDDTRAVAESHAGPMRTGYVHQEDLGFRAGQARNLGAAVARGHVLVFLDSGMLASRHLLAAHLAAHERGGRAVIGYIFGYDHDVAGRVGGEDVGRPPDELIGRFTRTGRHLDMREPSYREHGDRLDACAAPWIFYWTGNVSVGAGDFRAVGGFDADFVGWSGEDVEFARRLYEKGLTFALARRAASVEIPHERDLAALRPSYDEHALLLLRKHVDPVVEVSTICWAHELHPRLAELRRASKDRLLLARAWPDGVGADPGPSTVLFGADCLASVTGGAVCLEPDRGLAEQARLRVPDLEILPLHGFRTLFGPSSFDRALLAPSLRAYPPWAVDLVEGEAARIAREVRWLPAPTFDPAAGGGRG
ncbi:glycosyltransferase [Sphaerisporangium corydalis]|uniref:Glycosyltransferase n=1 Tax=Sphaerisporangium corydalis TaxID=1441875 RepID=A0ABV9EG43_9ACTN|nr:glycosyltransferase [Sphaerisporangium corydalis]